MSVDEILGHVLKSRKVGQSGSCECRNIKLYKTSHGDTQRSLLESFIKRAHRGRLENTSL